MAFSSLPMEVLSNIFVYSPCPAAYSALQRSNRSLWSVGSNDTVRLHFWIQYFLSSLVKEERLIGKVATDDVYKALCHFIGRYSYRAHTGDLRLAVQAIPTHYFCNHRFPSLETKHTALSFLSNPPSQPIQRSHAACPITEDPFAHARSITVHKGQPGIPPRRVYVDVTVQADESAFTQDQHFQYVIVGIDAVYAFDDELHIHCGRIVYKDEQVLADSLLCNLFESERMEVNHLPISQSHSIPHATHDGAMSLETYLLRSYQNVTLLHPVQKGGLKVGDKIDHVFVYVRQREFVCVEFCRSFNEDDVHPVGYLLLRQAGIAWQ